MKDIVILGAGGIGKEVALLIEEINKDREEWKVLGFLDDKISLQGKNINGYNVLGNFQSIKNMGNVYGICAFANYKCKERIVNSYFNEEIKLANIIHPSVRISVTNTIGKGVIIYSGVVITTNVKIGNNVIISPKCGIGHESVIQDYVSLLWNVNVSGNDILEEGCFVGSGATVIQNKRIGHGSIVGAGAVVTKDVPPNSVAVGCPAKIIKTLKNELCAKD